MIAQDIKRMTTDTNRPNKYSSMTLSAGIIAGLLLTLTPNKIASAEENTNHLEKENIQFLYNEFHSFIESEHNTEEEATEEVVQLVSENEEIRIIKDNLLDAIGNITSIDFVNQLHHTQLTIEQLDLIFEEIVSLLVEAEDSQISGQIEAIEVPELESEADFETEHTDQIDEDLSLEDEILETDQQDNEIVEESTTQEENLANQQDIVPEHQVDFEEIEEVDSEPSIATFSTQGRVLNETKHTTYIVKAGDTLDSIARKHQTTASHLASLNRLSNPNLIFVGQSLTISGKLPEQADNLQDLNKPLTSSEFIEVVGEHARLVASDHNLYASVMIAQAALESGYGKSTLSSAPNHNLFGIKGSYNGDSVTMKTSEYSNATGWITIYDAFKKYPSFKESLLDNATLLRNGLTWNAEFYAGTWIENTKSYKDATSWLEGRYATDPTYSTKLNNIINHYNLTRFDITPSGDLVLKPAPTPVEKPVTPSTSGSVYTVKAGDNLTKISQAYNMTVSQLKQLNGLTSDLIFVGQSLKIKVDNVVPAPTPTPAPKPVEKPVVSIPSTGTYKIKAGDTLSHIAIAHKMSVSELKQMNNLKSDLIFVGQNLKVSSSQATPAPAPKPVETPVVSNPTTGTYTVKAGDTLSHISRAYNMSVSELKQLNNLRSDLIFIGQSLKIKTNQVTPAPAPKPVEKPAVSNPTTGSYTVKSGDTLSHIARAYKMSVSDLKKLNNLRSDLIFLGQRLSVTNLSGKTVTPSSSSNSSTSSTHRVVRGDTLSGIAYRYGTTVRSLKQKNNLKSDLIFVGQILSI